MTTRRTYRPLAGLARSWVFTPAVLPRSWTTVVQVEPSVEICGPIERVACIAGPAPPHARGSVASAGEHKAQWTRIMSHAECVS